MIVYEVTDNSAPESNYCGSLAEARKSAKVIAHYSPGEAIPIERLEIDDLPRRQLALALLNRTGFVVDSQTVEAWRCEPCGKCKQCRDSVEEYGFHTTCDTPKRARRVPVKSEDE